MKTVPRLFFVAGMVQSRVVRAVLLLLLSWQLLAADAYLFTSFRGNGETGVYLALSRDGRQWTSLNNDQPFIQPETPGMLMRDPWLGQGPDGTWHLLWTWGWDRGGSQGSLKIGHSTSKDLLAWTPQREISLLQNEPTARNAWAPEAVWNAAQKEWIVFWATTIPGRFPDSEATGDTGYNHRIYSSTTKDWETFTPAKVFFNPGFNSIDSTIVHDGARWIMIFKDERKTPLKKDLRLAFATAPGGPWKDVSEPFTESWVEGPTAIRIQNDWWIYFDHYAKPQRYGAMRTRDWKTFEDMTAQVKFPAGQRHGTVVKIPEPTAVALTAFRSAR